ncbi:prolipoprotein diacylglyceryl transferase [Mycoplasmopsis pulmonis]|uniref:prolipoprotein diacylglyceryl transferase n=1 Tax=Mycoplasmopsis pulmonis TaxID=2107 RepID=UPI002ACE1FAE|nr:prolipoprotein diacylglyceryl transferase [Mycoplasmopsis pulmonis]MDZ7293435.1 prolipoprotein diacylglyceryl transferase [Mycoplasmopsis pulmonis]
MTSNFFPYKEGTATFLIDPYVRVYPIAILMGMIISILTVAFFWRKEKFNFDNFFALLFIIIPSSIIGARLWFVFERLIYNPQNPFPGSAWYAIWEGGLSIQGGVALPAILSLVYIYFKRDYIDYRKALSMILPTVLIGQAIGRWGNFANHEVYGKIDPTGQSSLIFGEWLARHMFIYNANESAASAAFRYPLFLYESISSIIGYIIIVWIIQERNLLKPGSNGGLYFVYYGTVRLAMEPLREESYFYYSLAAMFSILIGGMMMIYFEIWANPSRYVKTKIGKFRYQYDWTKVVVDKKDKKIKFQSNNNKNKTEGKIKKYVTK